MSALWGILISNVAALYWRGTLRVKTKGQQEKHAGVLGTLVDSLGFYLNASLF
jgi:hypothetical protein